MIIEFEILFWLHILFEGSLAIMFFHTYFDSGPVDGDLYLWLGVGCGLLACSFPYSYQPLWMIHAVFYGLVLLGGAYFLFQGPHQKEAFSKKAWLILFGVMLLAGILMGSLLIHPGFMAYEVRSTNFLSS